MFTFKLQAVLDCRKAIEEKVLLEFSEKKRWLVREKEALETLREEKMRLINDLKTMGNTTIHDVLLYTSYIKQLQEKEKKQEALTSQISLELEDMRRELLEAMKKRKAMEILKARNVQAYQAEVMISERKELDETAVQRFGRRPR